MSKTKNKKGNTFTITNENGEIMSGETTFTDIKDAENCITSMFLDPGDDIPQTLYISKMIPVLKATQSKIKWEQV